MIQTAIFRTYEVALSIAIKFNGPAWHNSCRIQPAYSPSGTMVGYKIVKASPQSQPLL